MDSPPWRRGPGRGAHGLGDRSDLHDLAAGSLLGLPEALSGLLGGREGLAGEGGSFIWPPSSGGSLSWYWVSRPVCQR
jgi:hypothetical protein